MGDRTNTSSHQGSAISIAVSPYSIMNDDENECTLLKDVVLHDDYELDEEWTSRTTTNSWSRTKPPTDQPSVDTVIYKHDVLCGRHNLLVGNGIGNRRFRALATKALGRFVNSKTSTDCWDVVHEIVVAIQSNGGRFLRKRRAADDDIYWCEVNFRQAHEIASCELKCMAKACQQQKNRRGSNQVATAKAIKGWPESSNIKNDPYDHELDLYDPTPATTTVPHIIPRSPPHNPVQSGSPPTIPGVQAWMADTLDGNGDEEAWTAIDLSRDDVLQLRQSFMEEHDWPLVSRVKYWLEQGHCSTPLSRYFTT